MAQPACRAGGFGGTWPGCGAGGPITGPLDFAQRTAPVIAGVAGLWAGLEQTPFDTLEILPGQTVRAVRAFYRRLDSSEVEERLRAQLFDPAGRLPLPRGGEVPVVYVEDVRRPRRPWPGRCGPSTETCSAARDFPWGLGAQAISIWAALKMF